MNVHKRCKKNVANNCGINSKQLAKMIEEMGLTPGNPRKKVCNRNNNTGSQPLSYTGHLLTSE
jgi:novel protein kinase C epsilon type